MDIQKEIVGLMKKHNLSREDIGSKLGISSQTVWRWQAGLSKPKSRIVLKAIEALKHEFEK